MKTTGIDAQTKLALHERKMTALLNNVHFEVLGYDRREKFFKLKQSGGIVVLRSLGETNILKLAPREWWAQHFPKSRGDNFDRRDALNGICRVLPRVGLYRNGCQTIAKNYQ
ncbi:hypothetical protein [Pararobbsia alpina]|uniref:Uncharacterized protein n=1 Tax=Pararobbsia alpina TaxID=621374 RepID=A0A6S7BNA5_9BURK|nr:hypothetical protein [Pararobbsia alpina]CAB3806827.1 hypothetical protein LMG28138_05850 [Pararobbsia alpina]